MNNTRANAIARIIVTFGLLINALLSAQGKNPIPIDEDGIYNIVSQIAAGAAVLWSWWKNANITKNALAAQGFKDRLDNQKKM